MTGQMRVQICGLGEIVYDLSVLCLPRPHLGAHQNIPRITLNRDLHNACMAPTCP